MGIFTSEAIKTIRQRMEKTQTKRSGKMAINKVINAKVYGGILKQFRRLLDVNQKEAAEILGISQARVSQIERKFIGNREFFDILRQIEKKSRKMLVGVEKERYNEIMEEINDYIDYQFELDEKLIKWGVKYGN